MLGRFAVDRELGRGGMGVVLAATDPALTREVAIKQALTHRAEDLLRFEREIRITARLEHPSIIPIYDAGTDEHGQPYYVMRRIAGEPLAERVMRSAALRDRLALVSHVVAAVDAAAYAHERGVLHRDIKPGNILIGPHGETFLIDWGLAREHGDAHDTISSPTHDGSPELTRAGQVYGTPGFMPPEQAHGEPVDARADVYALGVTLYFVLSGKVPLDGTLAWPPDGLPAELIAIVEKATAERPEDRYRDAGALATDLHAFLAGRLVGAHRYTRRQRVRRWLRRYRIPVALTAAALALALAIGIVAVQRLAHDRDLANVARREAEARRHDAEDRAEIALLDRASALVARDPTQVLTLLRQLPEQSRHAARARDIATSAASGGVAHGLRPHASWVHALALSPDGRLLASGGRDGTLQLHDLAARSSRIVYRGKYVQEVVWVGPNTIAFRTGNFDVRLYDLATQRTRDPGVKAKELWVSTTGELRYFDPVRNVVAVRPLAGGDEVIIARDVEDATGEGDFTIVRRGGQHELVEGTSSRALPALRWNSFAIDHGRRLVAGILDDHEVVEWDIDTGRTRRWALLLVDHVFYVGEGLYAAQASALVKLTERGVRSVAPGPWDNLRSTQIPPDGIALVADEKLLWILDRTGARPIPFPYVASAIAAHQNTVVAGTTDGMILWWELAPRDRFDSSEMATLCAIDETAVVTNVNHVLTVFDRATRTTATLHGELGYICHGLAAGRLILHNLTRQRILLDLSSGELDKRFAMIAYDPGATVVGVMPDRRDRVVELEGDRVVERWQGAGVVSALAVQGRWIGVQLDDGAIVHIDRTTNRSVLSPAQPTADIITVSNTGHVWLVAGDRLVHVEPGGGVATSRIDEPTAMLHAYGDRAVRVTEDRSLVLHAPNGTTLLETGSRTREVTFAGRRVHSSEGRRGDLVTYFIDTGEKVVRRLPPFVSARGAGGQDLAVLFSVGAIEVLHDPDPTPTALHRWIDAATNAVLAPNGALDWR